MCIRTLYSFDEKFESAVKKDSALVQDLNSAVAEFVANNSQLAGHHWGNEIVGGIGHFHEGPSKGNNTGLGSVFGVD